MIFVSPIKISSNLVLQDVGWYECKIPNYIHLTEEIKKGYYKYHKIILGDSNHLQAYNHCLDTHILNSSNYYLVIDDSSVDRYYKGLIFFLNAEGNQSLHNNVENNIKRLFAMSEDIEIIRDIHGYPIVEKIKSELHIR